MSYMKDEWIRRAQEAAETDAEWQSFLYHVCYGDAQAKDATQYDFPGLAGRGWKAKKTFTVQAGTQDPVVIATGNTVQECLDDIDFAKKVTCRCPHCGNSAWRYVVMSGDPVCESACQVFGLEVRCTAPSPSGSACGLVKSLHSFIPLGEGDMWLRISKDVNGWLNNRNAAATLKGAILPVTEDMLDKHRDPDKFLEEQRDKNLRDMFG